MLVNTTARAARLIFRPTFATYVGGVSGLISLAHCSPNAALVVSTGGVKGRIALPHRSPNAALAAATCQSLT